MNTDLITLAQGTSQALAEATRIYDILPRYILLSALKSNLELAIDLNALLCDQLAVEPVPFPIAQDDSQQINTLHVGAHQIKLYELADALDSLCKQRGAFFDGYGDKSRDLVAFLNVWESSSITQLAEHIETCRSLVINCEILSNHSKLIDEQDLEFWRTQSDLLKGLEDHFTDKIDHLRDVEKAVMSDEAQSNLTA